MNAEQYLQRIEKIDALTRDKLEDHQRWIDIANSLGGSSEGERVQTGRCFDKIQNAVAHYSDIEMEIDKLMSERKRIIANIEKLPVMEYKIIYTLYVSRKCKTVKELAGMLSVSFDSVKQHKKNGLRLIQKMIEKSEGT